MAGATNKQSAVGLPRSPGRPPGSPNRTTTIAKEAIALVADNLGGAARMTKWVQEDPANERIFWGQIYPKMLPLQVSGENGGAIVQRIESVIVDPKT
jgi:hypothetical protein